MERIVYDQMAQLDELHWWYRARREVLAALIRRTALPPSGGRILEIGCGTGHNLKMLAQFGEVDALEVDETARGLAEQRLGREVLSAPLPELLGVSERHYDLIGAFDVIEHIADDAAAVTAIAGRLRPGGRLVISVPAHQWMWSAHDTVNHHVRRYSKRQLRQLLEGSPLKLEKIGYFNSLLFPIAVAERLASRARGKEDSKLSLPPRPLNAALERAFAAERHLIARVPLPPGLSLFAVASATYPSLAARSSRPAMSWTMYSGRPFASLYSRPIYSPISASTNICTAPRTTTTSISEVQPWMFSPTSQA
jgi:SAM-dependent methyltransferase